MDDTRKSNISRKRKLPKWMTGKTTGTTTSTSTTTSASTSVDGGLVKPAVSDATNKISVLEEFLPELKFTGGILYSYQKNDCSLLCQDITCCLESHENPAVGFDIEWPVTYQRGREERTALVQICTSEKQCYLFHVSCMGVLPKGLKDMLSDCSIKKVGVEIASDLWKLERDFGIKAKQIIDGSMIDLSMMANKVVKSNENWSLDGLTRYLLKQKLCKDPAVRKSDWRQFPLSQQQQKYAATDAYASLLLYETLLEEEKLAQMITM